LIIINVRTQTCGLQLGGTGTFFINKGISGGGELIGNITVQKKLSIGAGIQALKFYNIQNIYAPAFETAKYFIPAKKVIYFLHMDPGYGFYTYKYVNKINDPNGAYNVNYKNTGGFYLGVGTGLCLKTAVAPYFNVQYSLYNYRYSINFKDVNYINRYSLGTITFSAGIWLHTKK
jgi:hypothetical protein